MHMDVDNDFNDNILLCSQHTLNWICKGRLGWNPYETPSGYAYAL